jgi:alanine racemase
MPSIVPVLERAGLGGYGLLNRFSAGPRTRPARMRSSVPARVQPRERARIADVARAAGVSKTAVSFAFNRPERLAAETAGRIRDVAAALGYRPHPVARMLARRRTMTIGVLTPQALAETFANPYFGTFAEGLARAAEARGYDLHLISPLQGSLALALGRASVDGVIAVGLSTDHPEVGQLRGAGLPMVLVDSGELAGHPSVSVDDEAGARAAAEHLLGLGHRCVLVLAMEGSAGPSPVAGRVRRGVVDRRLRGYRAAFEAAGADMPDAWIRSAPASITGGAAAFHSAWRAGQRPTGVLAMSDGLAIGAIAAARELGLGVPVDLSVVGFDDLDIARHLAPPLTTVHQDVREKGDAAVRLLAGAIDAPLAPPESVRLATTLEIRASTAPVREAVRRGGAAFGDPPCDDPPDA